MQAFGLLAQRLRHELGKKGIPLPSPGGQDAEKLKQPFRGVRDIRPRIDE